MRTLLINYEFPPLGGGGGNAARHLAAGLAECGDEVKVLTMAFAGLPNREWRDGYEIIRVPSIRRRADRCSPLEMTTFMLGGMYSAFRLLRTWKPDASLAFFSIPGAPIAWFLRLAKGVPYGVSLRGGDVPGFLPGDLAGYHRLTRPFIRFLWRRAEFVASNGGWLADMAHRCEPDMPIAVIPNGVDTDSHRPLAQRPEGPPRLLFVGRLARQKGVDLLLEAMARPRIGPDVSLDIVGDGDERPALEAQALRLGLEERVVFHSFLRGDDLRCCYQAADIFVLPSRDEGVANVLLEASASGLPIVATNVGGTSDAVRHEENGLLVEPENPDALADALARLLSAPAAARDMGETGREFMRRDFSWATNTKKYRSLLATISQRSTG